MAKVEALRTIAQRARNREREAIVAYLWGLADGDGAPFLIAAADLIAGGYHRPDGGTKD